MNQSALYLAEMLEGNTSLTSLDLGQARALEVSRAVVGRRMEVSRPRPRPCPFLAVCRSNLMGDEGIAAIAKALELNTTLTCLKLE